MTQKADCAVAPLTEPIAEATTERIERLKLQFKARFGRAPHFVAASPGRVNLIGEHIDYSGYAVLPIALESSTLIAVAPSERASIELQSTAREQFPDRELATDDFVIDSTIHEWSNYFKCGFVGVCQAYGRARAAGMQCLVDGTVPPGAGLSSSAALVCAAALGTAWANHVELTWGRLAEIAIAAERLAGVQTGGMDQSASLLAKSGHALLIEFVPRLAATPVVVPLGDTASSDGASFVIAHSGVTSDKHVSAPRCYNLRVSETRFASLMLSRAAGLQQLQTTLRGVEDALGGDRKRLCALVDSTLRQSPPYTRAEIARAVIPDAPSASDAIVKLGEIAGLGGLEVAGDAFLLWHRATHVLGESARVLDAVALCRTEPPLPVAEFRRRLGALMNESHASCRNLFDCSCTELDTLVKAMLDAGADGARLTGAGWGGCAVALVPNARLSAFASLVRQQCPATGLILTTAAAPGAFLVDLARADAP